MATYESSLVKKKSKVRGTHGGLPSQATGVLRVEDGDSIALADLIRLVPCGENVRPVRLILTATPVSGTPVLTNATFDIGVAAISATAFTRPDGTSFPAPADDTNALAAAVAVNTDNMATTVEVGRPVADSVSNYGPFYVTATPAGVGAFSVAGGDIDLALTIEFIGEQLADGFVYDEYVNQKVRN